MRKKTLKFIAAIGIVSFSLAFFSRPASAVTATDLLKKTMVNALDKCIGTDYWKSSIKTSDYKGISSLYATYGIVIGKMDDDGRVNLPTMIGNSITDGNLTCDQLINGYSGSGGNVSGLASLNGVTIPTDATIQAGEDFLKSLNYLPVSTTTSSGSITKKCLSISYGDSNGALNNTSNELCFRVDENDNVLSDDLEELQYSTSCNKSVCISWSFIGGNTNYMGFTITDTGTGSNRSTPTPIESSAIANLATGASVSWSDMKNGLEGVMHYIENPNTDTFAASSLYAKNVVDTVADTSGDQALSTVSSYNFDTSKTEAEQTAALVNTFSPSTAREPFTEYEKYTLYTTYLDEYYGLRADTTDCVDTNTSGYMAVNLSGSVKWCRIVGNTSTASSKGNVNGVSSDGYHLDKSMDYQDVITALNAIDYSGSDFSTASNLANVNTETGEIASTGPSSGTSSTSGTSDTNSQTGGSGSSSSDVKCATSTGSCYVDSETSTDDREAVRTAQNNICWDKVGVIGWLVCPLVTFAESAVEWIYDTLVEPSLKVPADLFTVTNDKGVGLRTAWQTFQTFANIIFVILLLVVIFSQLTGVGITNYGIKKILPNLIVAVILINLSYFLCQLAVDVSNILGSGVYNLFDSMVIGSDAGISDLASNLITAALGLGTVVILAIFLPGVLIMMLPTLIGAIISLLTLIALLAARQAAVVILIIIAPVAIALYMLPNTKKYFDKWIKAFSAMLVLYPVCGALVGGGHYAGSIIMTVMGDQLLGFITAILVNIIPMFFIPKLTKSSMTAIGGVGAALGNLAARASRGASGAVRRSEGFRNARQMSRMGLKYGKNEKGEIVPMRRRSLGNMISQKSSTLANKRGPLGAIGRAAGARQLRQDAEIERIAGQQARIAGIVGAENAARATAKTELKAAKAARNAANADVEVAEAEVREAQAIYDAANRGQTQLVGASGQTILVPPVSQAEQDLKDAKERLKTVQNAATKQQAAYSDAKQKRDDAIRGTATAKGAYNVGYVQATREYANRTATAKDSFVQSRLATLENDEKLKAIADQENLIASGKFSLPQINGGQPIRSTDLSSKGQAFRVLLDRAAAEPDNEELQNQLFAMANSLFAAGDPGRMIANTALQDAIDGGLIDRSGSKAISDLGAHLFSKYGATLHSIDKGSEERLLNLANLSADPTSTQFATQLANLKDRQHYDTFGLRSYTAESLNNADELVLRGFSEAYANGTLSAEDARLWEEQCYNITHNPDIQVKPKNQQFFTPAAENHSTSRTASVNSSGRMTETRTLQNGTTATSDITYQTRANTTTNNIHDVQNDYRAAVRELDSGVNASTGQPLTDAERASLSSTIDRAQAVLERTDAGRQFVHDEIINTVATSAAANGGTAQIGDGLRRSASRIQEGNYNSDFAQFANRIRENSQPIQSSEFTVQQVIPASGSNPAVTTYNYTTETRQTINDQTGTVTNYVPLAGQNVQIQTSTPPVQTATVMNSIRNDATTINNTSATPAQITAAQEAINRNVVLASTSNGGLEGLRDEIRRLAVASAGAAPSAGLAYLASRVTPEIEAKLDAGTVQMIADARGSQMKPANDQSYAIPSERVYDRYNDTAYTRSAGVNGTIEYRDASGARVQVDQTRIINSNDRSDQLQGVANTLAQIANSLQQQGYRLENNGQPRRFRDRNGRNTELMYLDTTDGQRHFYNTRTGQRSSVDRSKLTS